MEHLEMHLKCRSFWWVSSGNTWIQYWETKEIFSFVIYSLHRATLKQIKSKVGPQNYEKTNVLRGLMPWKALTPGRSIATGVWSLWNLTSSQPEMGTGREWQDFLLLWLYFKINVFGLCLLESQQNCLTSAFSTTLGPRTSLPRFSR